MRRAQGDGASGSELRQAREDGTGGPELRQSQAQTQAQAHALGDGTRNRIFRHLVDAPGPVSVAELTALVELNHNAVRQHLAVLKDAALVVEEHEHRTRPGRPRLLYRINPAVRGLWGTAGPYELLATLYSQMLLTGSSPRDVGFRAGRRRARRARHADDALASIQEDLETGGFEPETTLTAEGADFVLGRCPFVEVAATDPATVCQLHRGMAEGVAAALGLGTTVELDPHDPRRAGCRLRARVPARREHART